MRKARTFFNTLIILLIGFLGPKKLSTKQRGEQKLILVSIGYATCHWCHVMERESFEDIETAAFLNKNFISIKVDREERPDVDQVFMDALHALGEQGGWPLNMFATPDGRPFTGGTYFPPKPMYGRQSFRQIFGKSPILLAKGKEKIHDTAEQLTTYLKGLQHHNLWMNPYHSGIALKTPYKRIGRFLIMRMVDLLSKGLINFHPAWVYNCC